MARVALPGGTIVSRPPLTSEQRAPIVARGVSIALAAGAGCGKTTVLTERFVSLLEGEDRLALHRVVALTFTEKAARELRDRVHEVCLDRVDSGVEPGYWRGIVRGLESARISTFHSFCGDAVRRFAVEAGVDPAFEVLDASVAPAIRERALDAATRVWLAERDPDFAALAIDYGLKTIRDALGKALADRPDVDLDAWADREPEAVLAEWERFRDAMPIGSLLQGLVEKHRPTLDFLASQPCSHAAMNARRLRVIDALPQLPLATKPLADLAAIREDAMVKGGGGPTAWQSEDVHKEVGKRFTKLREDIDDLTKLLADDFASSIDAARSAGQFARVLRRAIADYDRAKAEEGVLDFHDLQAKLLDLLMRDDPTVRDELRGSIDALLVDEFQDTDTTESAILDLLAGEAAHSGRLFLVGDAKQSIYGFRGAKPAIFGAYRGAFPDGGRLDLTENFRSVPAILDFVNALFLDTFPGAEHLLKPGRDEATPDGFAIEFHWAGGPDAKVSASADRRREAESIARLLRSRLDAGWTVRERSTGKLRRATAGDVAILFRTRGGFSDFERTLTDAGLDYQVVGGTTYYAQQEVIDILNVLAAVEDPLDPLALAGTLRGPLFGVSDEGLYWLAAGGTRDLVESFADWEPCRDRLAEDDRAAIARAAQALARWRGLKDRVPIADLIDVALDESGYEAALMGEHLGPRKRANVRKLVEIARKFDERGSLTLGDFVAKLRSDVIDPPREDQAATADDAGDAVRLMTIHQAKGLEFPIVVLPDIEHKPQHNTDLLTWHPDLGPLPRARAEDGEEVEPRNLAREIAAELERAADREEALRLLYVAMTRARDRLIVSNPSRPVPTSSSPPAVALLAERFDLATGQCVALLPSGLASPVVGVIGSMPANSKEAPAPKFRPKILFTSRRILDAPAPSATATAPIARRPDRIVLDAGSRLNPTMREVDRLVRCVIHKPAPRGTTIAACVEQAARMIGTFASRRVRELAESRLASWLDGLTARRIAVAAEVVADLRWTFAWPIGDVRGTVYAGRVDVAIRDRDGTWSLVGVTIDESEAALADLRLSLRLAAYAADVYRIGPVASASLVTLAEPPRVERIDGFGERDIERAIVEAGV